MHRRNIQALILSAALTACSAAAVGRDPVTAPRPFTVTPLATFDEPWAMAVLPDGSALITQKAGQLKLWRAGQQAVDVAGVPPVVVSDQGGLLDVVLSPSFTADKQVYLTFSRPEGKGDGGLALARATLTHTGATSALTALKLLWSDPAGGKGGQFGARITFAPDGKSLFLSSGERQRFSPAQNPDQPLGKILHLTLDGQPAPGNPSAGQAGAPTVTITDPPRNTGAAKSATGHSFAWPGPNRTRAETWTTGHRNPYGLAFDADGRLWETEMGPKGGDELNLIVAGRNYGWPKASNGSNYDGSDIPDHQPGDGFEPPKLWWNPSISPAGLMIYRGGRFPQWQGDAFLPSLSAEALIRVHLHGATATKGDQWPLGHRIRAVQQGPAGEIYLLEDGSGARLLRLEPVKP